MLAPRQRTLNRFLTDALLNVSIPSDKTTIALRALGRSASVFDASTIASFSVVMPFA
jgi:hypothetical protein